MTTPDFKPPNYYTPRRSPSPLIVAVIAGVLAVLIGVGLAFLLQLGPFAPGTSQPTSNPTSSAGSTRPANPSGRAWSRPRPRRIRRRSYRLDPPRSTPGHHPPRMTPRGSCSPTYPRQSGRRVRRGVRGASCRIGELRIGRRNRGDVLGLPRCRQRCTPTTTPASTGHSSTATAACATRRIRTGRSRRRPQVAVRASDYSIGGSPVGRYFCIERELPTITWTDDRLNIGAVAAASTGDSDRLVSFWLNEAGPIP